MRRYREPDADNARWDGFEFRAGDIIVDAPSKSGTTWTQLLVALLIFDGPVFPEPIGRMSLWIEQMTRPVAEAHAVFASQTHRRFIKSHTPLDGVPERDDVFYVCVGRDPRDAAVSLVHHIANMDRDRFAELIAPQAGSPQAPAEPPSEEPSPEERLARYYDRFVDTEAVDAENPDWTLQFLVHHYTTFWERRRRTNVELFHFADYRADLPGELVRLARFLEIEVSPGRAARLAEEATIDAARLRASDIAPEAHRGIWKDTESFFRSGESGQWKTEMTAAQQARYLDRVAALAPPDLAAWIHGGRRGS